MTGLLIKDWMLLKRQGRYFMIVLALACILSFMGSESFSSFVTSYLTFMISMFNFSLFSYDEFDNGMAFLMTLPSGRSDYVKARYTFSILLTSCGWLVGTLLRMGLYLVRFSVAEYIEILPSEPMYLLICLIYMGLAFPALIKYGAEKGRNIAFTVLAIFAIGIFMIAKAGFEIPFLKWIDRLAETNPFILLPPLAAVSVLIMTVSYALSVRIIAKKEF